MYICSLSLYIYIHTHTYTATMQSTYRTTCAYMPCVYVCMYVCILQCMYVYACMYVCTCVCCTHVYIHVYVGMCVSRYVSTSVCMYTCMYAHNIQNIHILRHSQLQGLHHQRYQLHSQLCLLLLLVPGPSLVIICLHQLGQLFVPQLFKLLYLAQWHVLHFLYLQPSSMLSSFQHKR